MTEVTTGYTFLLGSVFDIDCKDSALFLELDANISGPGGDPFITVLAMAESPGFACVLSLWGEE